MQSVTPMRALLLLLLVAPVSACSPFKSVALADAPDQLTSGTADPLFTVTLDPGGFNVGLLGIAANLPGQPQIVLSCRDTEPSPGVLVETCFEPGSNLFDTTSVGKPVQIELYAQRWPSRSHEYTLQLLTWVPEN